MGSSLIDTEREPRPPHRGVKEALIVLFACAAAALAVYWHGLHTGYYGDDVMLVFTNPSRNIFTWFYEPNPGNPMYRPLSSMILAIIQSLAGSNTLPIHLITLTVHAMCATLVYVAARALRLPIAAALFAGGYMLLSQANAMAVTGNDTLSQVASTLLGFVSLWLFYTTVVDPDMPASQRLRRRMWSLAALLTAFLFKETAASFVLSITCVAVWFRKEANPATSGRFIRALLPVYALAALYTVIRFSIVQSLPGGQYALAFGLNVPSNLAMSVFSSLTPISTVDTITLLRSHATLAVMGVCAVTLAVAASLLSGIRRRDEKRLGLLLGLIAMVQLVPPLFFTRTSELYVYQSMPVISLLFGMGVSAFIGWSTSGKTRRVSLILAVFLLFCAHIFADVSKTEHVAESGKRFGQLLPRVLPYFSHVPQNGLLILENPAGTPARYSVFIQEAFNVFQDASGYMQRVSGRQDVRVIIRDNIPDTRNSSDTNAVVLILVDGDVRRK